MGRGKEGARSREGGEVQQSRHPSHAVAAQPHFATSILPARLHSHSVDPFTEGMSHMPPSPPPPPLPPPFPPPYSLLSFKPPHPALCSHTPRDPCLRQSGCFSFYLILPSIPLLHPSSPTSALPSPNPSFSRHYLAVFLSRSLVQLHQSVPLSLRLCCVVRGGSGTAGRSGREVAPFAASRNLARCSFAVHREERERRSRAVKRKRYWGKREREREKPRG